MTVSIIKSNQKIKEMPKTLWSLWAVEEERILFTHTDWMYSCKVEPEQNKRIQKILVFACSLLILRRCSSYFINLMCFLALHIHGFCRRSFSFSLILLDCLWTCTAAFTIWALAFYVLSGIFFLFLCARLAVLLFFYLPFHFHATPKSKIVVVAHFYTRCYFIYKKKLS